MAKCAEIWRAYFEKRRQFLGNMTRQQVEQKAEDKCQGLTNDGAVCWTAPTGT